MKYPPEVQKRIDILESYEWVEPQKLHYATSLHMYRGKIAYPEGYYDSRWFDLVLYNDKTIKRAKAGRHDGIITTKAGIRSVSYYADGSTLVVFDKPVEFDLTQAVYFWEERR